MGRTFCRSAIPRAVLCLSRPRAAALPRACAVSCPPTRSMCAAVCSLMAPMESLRPVLRLASAPAAWPACGREGARAQAGRHGTCLKTPESAPRYDYHTPYQ